MKIALGADHGGINLKSSVIKAIEDTGNTVVDFGTMTADSVDYPVYAKKVALAVRDHVCGLGILLCGTGIGMSIAANKIKGVRCGHVTNVFSAVATREHNNANIIALGGRITTETEAYDIVKAYLTATFLGERHQNRVDMINNMEND